MEFLPKNPVASTATQQKVEKKHKIRHNAQIIGAIAALATKKLLPKSQLKVLAALATYADPNGTAFPRQKTLAAKIGCGIKNITRMLSRLAQSNIIEKRKNDAGYIIKNGKRYVCEIIYHINMTMIRTIQQTKNVKKQHKKIKIDHLENHKNDHHINTPIGEKNKHCEQKPSVHRFDLQSLFINANKANTAHLNKIKHSAARVAGLTRWRIAQGFEYSPAMKKTLANKAKIQHAANNAALSIGEQIHQLSTKLLNDFSLEGLFTHTDYANLKHLTTERQYTLPITIQLQLRHYEKKYFNG